MQQYVQLLRHFTSSGKVNSNGLKFLPLYILLIFVLKVNLDKQYNYCITFAGITISHIVFDTVAEIASIKVVAYCIQVTDILLAFINILVVKMNNYYHKSKALSALLLMEIGEDCMPNIKHSTLKYSGTPL